MTIFLDRQFCEQARQSRDPRFDGKFFVAVISTGIYCRNVCRVKLPLAKNVVFYGSAAVAQKKGFAHVYAAGQKQYQVPLLGKELAQV